MSLDKHPDPPIPFTVLGGWLGAGKTTLVNRLLSETDERIAVVVNDIGEINIDADLIAAASPEVVELTNGCVCCSIGSSLAITLRDLTLRTPRPQRIVLEASGIADPARVARYGDRGVVPLDAVITVVDAADISGRLVDPLYGRLARAQIEACDLAILTKLDTVTAAAGDAAFETVRGICRGPVIAADSTIGWAAAVLTDACARPEDVTSGPPNLSPTSPTSGQEPVADPKPAADPKPTSDQEPAAPVASAVWAFDEAVEVDDVVARLRCVPGLLRAKGFVDTSEGAMLVQAAGSRISVTPSAAGGDHIGRLVVLTREPVR